MLDEYFSKVSVYLNQLGRLVKQEAQTMFKNFRESRPVFKNILVILILPSQNLCSSSLLLRGSQTGILDITWDLIRSTESRVPTKT